MKNTQKGFVGLIGLLIAAALVTYWVVKIMPAATTPSTSTQTEGSNSSGFGAIDQAKEAKDLIEKRWADTISQ